MAAGASGEQTSKSGRQIALHPVSKWAANSTVTTGYTAFHRIEAIITTSPEQCSSNSSRRGGDLVEEVITTTTTSTALPLI